MRFVLASHNQKKCAELAAILADCGIEIVLLPENAPEPEETGTTFAENARIKARTAFAYTGLPAIADDSGLVVDALQGQPGVYSARYCAGTDADRNAFLLQNMEQEENRTARFVCAICCILPNEQELSVEGSCEGLILRELQGTEGFGYDPLFYVPEFDATFAQLPAGVKNTISHRARALQHLQVALQNYVETL